MANRYNILCSFLQETHFTNADEMMIPNYTLAGWISSRKHGLTTFAHERLKPTFVDQILEGSTTEWLYVGVDGCKIVDIYKPTNSNLKSIANFVFQHPCLYSGH